MGMSRRTKRTLSLTIGCAALATTGVSEPSAGGPWSTEQAQIWYEKQPWLVGCNFLPSTAVNDVEMWQNETFDPETIERELVLAEGVGFNTVRVFLNFVVWQSDAEGLKERFRTFLSLADRRGITAMPVLFDDCNFAGRVASAGIQPDPVPGVHNSQWVSSPSLAMVEDQKAWPELESYVKDLIGTFGKDRRVVVWDLYNEPGNSGMDVRSLPLMEAAFAWARKETPRQPLTVAFWQGIDSPLSKRMIELSDILSFHAYTSLPNVKSIVEQVSALGRPLLCTEWMARGMESRFETHMPYFKENKIGCWSWGLVAGRTQTYYPWGSPQGAPEPALWHHDIFRAHGDPFSEREVEAIRLSTGAGLHACDKAGKQTDTISVLDFGAKPNSDSNSAEALRLAVAACVKGQARRLLIPPGRYILRDEKAVRLQDEAISGRLGGNPQDVVYRPHFEYVKGLDFAGAKDLVVEATGVELICDGWMEPLSLMDCKNVTIKGLTIDYERPPFSVGTLINVQNSFYDVQFEEGFPVSANIVMPRVMVWEPRTQELLSRGASGGRSELIAPQTLRIHAMADPQRLGAQAIYWHSFHFRPAILIYRCENTVLSDVTLHAHAGMGIVGHRSTDITLNRLRVVPRPGLHISTNTDATHFISCRGTLTFQDCQFEGQGDDSTNVHVYYFGIRPGPDQRSCTLQLDHPEFGTHSQLLDCPEPGDVLELVERRTLKPVRSYAVLSVSPDEAQFCSSVTLNEDLPSDVSPYLLVDTSALPKVRIRGCDFRAHRARALLIKTRDVVIEDCTFDRVTGTAIQVGAEASWGEGIPPSDIVIQRNRILRCGEDGDGRIEGANAIMVGVLAEDPSTQDLIRGVTLADNEIRGKGQRAIFIGNAAEVKMKHNRIEGYAEQVYVQNSKRVDVSQNHDLVVHNGENVTSPQY